MTTRAFHVALHTNESVTRMTVDDPPGSDYAMVSSDPGALDDSGSIPFLWRLLGAVLPAPPGEGYTLKSNDLPEPEWQMVPNITVSDDPPIPNDGMDGDVWIEY